MYGKRADVYTRSLPNARRAMTTDNPIEPELIVAAIDAAEADRRRHRRCGSHWIGWLRRLP
jgi:hypothetical protein